jgi:site-specific DNA recombinase
MPPGQGSEALRAFVYARVSSDLQSAASIEDQLRVCAEWAAKQAILVTGSHADQAISGARACLRPGRKPQKAACRLGP